MKKKVLGIFCHPDDEILWGWPIFQSNKFEKHLVICCDDFLRRGPIRRQALQQVCKQENIRLERCLSENNNFYSLPTRRATNLLTDAIKRIELTFEAVIRNIKPDYIFTHNPMGEYGHGSHRLLFELVSQNELVKNLLITDICQKSNHRSTDFIPKFIWDLYYEKSFWDQFVLDMDFYNRCKAVYDKYIAWTWSKPPIEFASLHILKEER